MSTKVYWVDASILLRFLTGSPQEQAHKAARLLRRCERGEVVLHVHSVVVAEIVWVLRSFYEYSRQEIASALIPLLSEHGLKVEGARTVVQALELMAEQNVDYADALLAETALARNEGLSSFDKGFRKLGVEWHEPR